MTLGSLCSNLLPRSIHLQHTWSYSSNSRPTKPPFLLRIHLVSHARPVSASRDAPGTPVLQETGARCRVLADVAERAPLIREGFCAGGGGGGGGPGSTPPEGASVVVYVGRRRCRRSSGVLSDRARVFLRQDGDRLFVGAVGSWYWQGKSHRSFRGNTADSG